LKILLIEDHIQLAEQLVAFLSGHGWTVDHASRGKQGINLALEQVYDLVILDLGLPDMDGIEVCRTIKASSDVNIPVLMLTARDSFSDKVTGFDVGADEYLTKPYDLRELALRCQVLTRRKTLFQNQSIELGPITLDITKHSVTRDEVDVVLNKASFTILKLLVEAHPNPVSRSRLIHELWGDEPPETDALKSHIYNLRAAIDKPFDTALVKTVTNLGYKLDLL